MPEGGRCTQRWSRSAPGPPLGDAWGQSGRMIGPDRQALTGGVGLVPRGAGGAIEAHADALAASFGCGAGLAAGTVGVGKADRERGVAARAGGRQADEASRRGAAEAREQAGHLDALGLGSAGALRGARAAVRTEVGGFGLGHPGCGARGGEVLIAPSAVRSRSPSARPPSWLQAAPSSTSRPPPRQIRRASANQTARSRSIVTGTRSSGRPEGASGRGPRRGQRCRVKRIVGSSGSSPDVTASAVSPCTQKATTSVVPSSSEMTRLVPSIT